MHRVIVSFMFDVRQAKICYIHTYTCNRRGLEKDRRCKSVFDIYMGLFYLFLVKMGLKGLVQVQLFLHASKTKLKKEKSSFYADMCAF